MTTLDQKDLVNGFATTSLRRQASALVAEPSVQRALVGVALGVALLLWPDSSLSLAVAAAGVALIVMGAGGVARAVRQKHVATAVRSILDVILGIVLLLISSAAASLISWGVALALVIRGLVDIRGSVQAKRAATGFSTWFAVRAAAQLAGAVAVVILGSGVVILILLFIGVSWVVGGVIGIAMALNQTQAPVASSTEATTTAIVATWFRSQDVGEEARDQIVDKLVFEGPVRRHRVARFASLMAFATAIATLGVQTDSTAVVIGAMLVAPLMTPIMATSLSLVMGRPARALQALTLVATGVAIAVGLSFFVARYAPGIVQISANSQIAARTAPTLLDLLIALAAGCAGGYAVCRPDVSDSLPGVAIAVALVPPLAVVGITLSGGEPAMAFGAFLLFLTNLVGIIVSSALVFAGTGVAPWGDLVRNAAQLRRTSTTLLGALVLISIPLAITGRQILNDSSDQQRASTVVDEWLIDELGVTTPSAEDGLASLEVVAVTVEANRVEVVLIGDRDIRDPNVLADHLAVALDHSVQLNLRIIPEERISVESLND